MTTTSSLGMWAPVFNDEWEGDVYLGAGDKSKETETTTGKVVFKGELLPWQTTIRISEDSRPSHKLR